MLGALRVSKSSTSYFLELIYKLSQRRFLMKFRRNLLQSSLITMITETICISFPVFLQLSCMNFGVYLQRETVK